MHADATTPAEPPDAVAILSGGNGLPYKRGRSASAISFSRPAQRSLAFRPAWSLSHLKVTRYTRVLQRITLPPAPPWLLPAERPIGRVGFAPTENRRLSRHTPFTACLTRHELMGQPSTFAVSFRDLFLAAESLVDVVVDFLKHVPVYHAAFKQHLRQGSASEFRIGRH